MLAEDRAGGLVAVESSDQFSAGIGGPVVVVDETAVVAGGGAVAEGVVTVVEGVVVEVEEVALLAACGALPEEETAA